MPISKFMFSRLSLLLMAVGFAALLAAGERDAPVLVTPEVGAAVLEDIPEAGGFIRSSTQRMDRPISAILRLSREGRRLLHPEPIEVPTDRAVSLGVILTELVTNALKYAYPAGEEGPITVRLERRDDHGLLAVQDQGIGPKPSATGTGLGRRIVESLSQSVGGMVTQTAGPGGTAVSIRFTLA
jgi:anti-sigma regulatory factor (Ser/Thr protein kinase)